MKSQKIVKQHDFIKSGSRAFLKLYILGGLMNLGLVGWYYLDYDLNIWNPELSEYITDRLG
jgi:hypothetical protein